MEGLINFDFWIVAIALAVILSFFPNRLSMWFGWLNIFALCYWIGYKSTLIACAFSIILWCVLWLIKNSNTHKVRKNYVSLSLIVILFILFIIHKINIENPSIVNFVWEKTSLEVPGSILKFLAALSFSYVTLRAVDLSLSVLFRENPLLDPISCFGFLFPFHMLISGPISQYSEHLKISEIHVRDYRIERFLLSANNITTGLIYKYLIAEYLVVFAFGVSGKIELSSIFDTAYLFIYIFFDFAGYSLIAIGIGRILGIPTPENFETPFKSKTITEFFTSWHMSLGNFIQRNVYTPLQLKLVRLWGLRKAVWAGLSVLLLSWIIVGIWHRVSLKFLIYGVCMAIWIWTEKIVRDHFLKSNWSKNRWAHWASSLFGPMYVFCTMTIMLHLVIKEIL